MKEPLGELHHPESELEQLNRSVEERKAARKARKASVAEKVVLTYAQLKGQYERLYARKIDRKQMRKLYRSYLKDSKRN